MVDIGPEARDARAVSNTQVDGLERLAELAKNASPEERARLERTIDAIIRSRRLRSMTRKTVQQVEEKLTSTEQGPC
jgi:hypothetical protein